MTRPISRKIDSNTRSPNTPLKSDPKELFDKIDKNFFLNKNFTISDGIDNQMTGVITGGEFMNHDSPDGKSTQKILYGAKAEVEMAQHMSRAKGAHLHEESEHPSWELFVSCEYNTDNPNSTNLVWFVANKNSGEGYEFRSNLPLNSAKIPGYHHIEGEKHEGAYLLMNDFYQDYHH